MKEILGEVTNFFSVRRIFGATAAAMLLATPAIFGTDKATAGEPGCSTCHSNGIIAPTNVSLDQIADLGSRDAAFLTVILSKLADPAIPIIDTREMKIEIGILATPVPLPMLGADKRTDVGFDKTGKMAMTAAVIYHTEIEPFDGDAPFTSVLGEEARSKAIPDVGYEPMDMAMVWGPGWTPVVTQPGGSPAFARIAMMAPGGIWPEETSSGGADRIVS